MISIRTSANINTCDPFGPKANLTIVWRHFIVCSYSKEDTWRDLLPFLQEDKGAPNFIHHAFPSIHFLPQLEVTVARLFFVDFLNNDLKCEGNQFILLPRFSDYCEYQLTLKQRITLPYHSKERRIKKIISCCVVVKHSTYKPWTLGQLGLYIQLVVFSPFSHLRHISKNWASCDM